MAALCLGLYGLGLLVVTGLIGFFAFVGVALACAIAFADPNDAMVLGLTAVAMAVWLWRQYHKMTALPRNVKEEPKGDEYLAWMCSTFGVAPVKMYQLTDVPEVNAWALPNAILVSRGLVEISYQDPAVAEGILAHEVAHLALGHPRLRGIGAAVFGATEDLAGHVLARARAQANMKALNGALREPTSTSAFQPYAAGVGGIFGIFQAMVAWIGLLLTKLWIRQAEYEADALAARMGYGEQVSRALELSGGTPPEVPAGAPAFGENGKNRDVFAGFHPSYAQRLERLRRLGLLPSKPAADQAEAAAQAEVAPGGQPEPELGQPGPEPEQAPEADGRKPVSEPEPEPEPGVVVLPSPEFLARAAAREAERVRSVVEVRTRAAEDAVVMEVLVAPDLSAAAAAAVARRAAARAERALEALGVRWRLEVRYDWASGPEGE